jgi:uncharacterized protein
MRAEALIIASRPAAADLHLVESGVGRHALVVDGSRLYDLDVSSFQALRAAVPNGAVPAAIAALGLGGLTPSINDEPPTAPLIYALSLAIAQKCNLGCTYCYAREGAFGGTAKNMTLEGAVKSVDLLLAGKKAGDRVNLAFMGGEPLLNRAVLRETVRYAVREAQELGVVLGFSITTNGTLLTESDADFFGRSKVGGVALSKSIVQWRLCSNVNCACRFPRE